MYSDVCNLIDQYEMILPEHADAIVQALSRRGYHVFRFNDGDRATIISALALLADQSADPSAALEALQIVAPAAALAVAETVAPADEGG